MVRSEHGIVLENRGFIDSLYIFASATSILLPSYKREIKPCNLIGRFFNRSDFRKAFSVIASAKYDVISGEVGVIRGALSFGENRIGFCSYNDEQDGAC
jgi:hypothetical protein